MALIPKIQTTIGDRLTKVQRVSTKMADDIDALWYRDFNRTAGRHRILGSSGAFEVHAGALYQTYQAFLAGGHEIEGGIYVLEGIGPADPSRS